MISMSFSYGPVFSSVPELNQAAVWFSNNYGPGDALHRLRDGIFPWGYPTAMIPIEIGLRLMVERRFSSFRRTLESSVEDFADGNK